MNLKDQKPIETDEDEDKFVVGTYLSGEVKDRVKLDAKTNKRSVSSQIAWIIEKYYEALKDKGV